MLDSSPLSAPPRKKLKRTASLASLPSPPPTVQQAKKRQNVGKSRSDGETASESDDDDDLDEGDGGAIIGRKLLFPAAHSQSTLITDGSENPFIDNEKPADIGEQLALDADTSPLKRPKLASPSRRKASSSKSAPVAPRTPSPKRSVKSVVNELPVLDEDDNPFLVTTPKPKKRRARPPPLAEQPTLTYVFKGVKTVVPNPHYNLSESAFENSKLPLSDPRYSPPPYIAPCRLFSLAGRTPAGAKDDEDEEDEEEERESSPVGPRTPEPKAPVMSKVFVDVHGNPLPDSGPQGVRGKVMDAEEVGRMAIGPIRSR